MLAVTSDPSAAYRMKGQILVLGAAGRLGFAAAEAFRDAGWSVKGLVRPGAAWRAPRGIDVIETNDRAVAVKEARGTDIVLHALNAPYTGWAQHALPLTYSAIEAAEQSGATLIFPGNVYNYGAGMPAVLDETTPMQPTSRKGKLRDEMELRLREASDRGVRTIILRAGDFFGRGRGSWFDLVLIKELAKNRVTYPGPLDVVHEWTYLPDYIDALIGSPRSATRSASSRPSAFPATPSPARNSSRPSPRRPAARSRSATSTGG